MNDLILYTTEDGRSQIKLRAQEDTVWLTQLEIAELFATSKQNIGQHVKSIFEEGELQEASVVKQHFTTAADGKSYLTLLYNLEAILAVGYRVRSPRGVQFRRWDETRCCASSCRHRSGFQPSGMCLPHTWGDAPGWYGLGPLALQNGQAPQGADVPMPCPLLPRQRRISIPAWGNAPGVAPQTTQGPKARPIPARVNGPRLGLRHKPHEG